MTLSSTAQQLRRVRFTYVPPNSAASSQFATSLHTCKRIDKLLNRKNDAVKQ